MSEKPNLFKGVPSLFSKNSKESTDSQLADESPDLADTKLVAATEENGHDDELRQMFEESKLFDAQWYLQQNPDVAAAQIDPFTHYVLNGEKEGRDPSSDFDVLWYAKTYPDFENSGLGLLEHYLLKGREQNKARNQADLREKLEHEPSFSQQKHACKMVALRTYNCLIVQRRVNLLIDNDRDEVIPQLYVVAAQLANATDSTLRIVTRTSKCSERIFKQQLSLCKIKMPLKVEFSFCDYLDAKSELPISRCDFFLVDEAVNLSSLQTSVSERNIVYLDHLNSKDARKSRDQIPAPRDGKPRKDKTDSVKVVSMPSGTPVDAAVLGAIAAELAGSCKNVFV